MGLRQALTSALRRAPRVNGGARVFTASSSSSVKMTSTATTTRFGVASHRARGRAVALFAPNVARPASSFALSASETATAGTASDVDAAKGVWTGRWGDAPIRRLGLALSVAPDRVHRFSDIAYAHAPFVAQPPGPLPRARASVLETALCGGGDR